MGATVSKHNDLAIPGAVHHEHLVGDRALQQMAPDISAPRGDIPEVFQEHVQSPRKLTRTPLCGRPRLPAVILQWKITNGLDCTSPNKSQLIHGVTKLFAQWGL